MGRTSIRLSESSTSSLNHVEAEMPEEGYKRQGWYLSYAGAFIVVLAAIALSTAVGLIVHFAHPARRLQCQPCPTHTPVTSRPATTSPVIPNWDEMWEVCKNLSVSRNESLPGFTTALPTSTTPVSTAPPKSIRLPDTLAPIHYDIRLRPFIYSNNTADFYFNGSVRAQLRCVQPTKVITLHDNIRGGTHSNIRVMKTSSNLPIKVVSWSFEDDLEFIHLELEETLEVNQVYEVSIDYSAPLLKDLKGIYYSDYTINGEKRYLITSQLQTTGARKVFPCLDEPALKATFNTTIERMSHLKSMSNTEVIRSEPLADGWVADHYGVTPVMSTYILAFMVSDFNCTSSTTSNGKLVEICARPNAMDQTTFASEIAGPMQEFFEAYHNISYPLPKTIHTAVQDFAAGAMENWGLIIYRETALLYDAAAATADQRQRVAKVIAHELAHQWFGNLVTAKWWDHIWLNEGFASYLENIGLNSVFPTWNTLDEMVVTKVQRVFGADSLVSSRPIYQQVNTYNDISQVFDPITYSKGASVIRMMKHFLGEKTFRWGLSNYLKDRAYSTATSCDLFKFLSKQAELDGKTIDVEGIMDTWVRQMGYPVVTFNFDNATGNVDLKQSHFLLNPKQTVERKSPYGYIWKIPISVVTSKTTDLEKHASGWLNDPTGKIDMKQKGVNWILGNIKQRYFYRVNYNSENWDALVAQLLDDPMKIDQTNRAQIIDDTMNLGRAGHVDQTLTLRVARYLTAEKEIIPWVAVSRAFGYMDRMLSQTSFYGYFRIFMQKNVENTHDLIGWDKSNNDTHLQQRLRTRITNLACHYGLKSCLQAADTRFQQWMKDDTTNGTNSIDRNLRPVVYCSGVETGDVAEWEFAFKKYQEVNTGAEKSTLLRAMACTRNYWLIRRYLQEALGEKVLRRQDFHIVLRHVAANPIGRGIAWNFLQDNWKLIKERFGLSTFALRSAVTSLSAAFSTERELRELQGFMVSNPDQGTATGAFKKAVETTKSNIEWRQKNENNIKQWLQNNSHSVSL